jgi:hypothetical protein
VRAAAPRRRPAAELGSQACLFCRCLALGLVRGIAVFLVAVLLRSGLGVTADGPVPGGRTLAVLRAVQEYRGDERRR